MSVRSATADRMKSFVSGHAGIATAAPTERTVSYPGGHRNIISTGHVQWIREKAERAARHVSSER